MLGLALFKIEKGFSENLAENRPNTTEGYCYFTKDDGKFYIDTSTAEGTESRVLLNAGNADTVDGHSVDDSISDTSSKNVPTTEAVVKYIQSLSYNGEYESI